MLNGVGLVQSSIISSIILYGLISFGSSSESFNPHKGLSKFRYESASSCRDCHKVQFEEWGRSAHRHAFSNPLFQRGFRHEKNLRCLNCHLPLEIQRKSFLDGKKVGLTDGVTCVSCHTSHESQSSRIQDPKLCSSCHQFNFHQTDVAAQNTYKEWLDYKKQGGRYRCQDCHMPNRSHEFRFKELNFPYSIALKIAHQLVNNVLVLKLKNVGAGHNIPTGDIFRHLQIQKISKAKSTVLHYVGRNPYFRNIDKTVVWKNQNSIRPGEEREFKIPVEEADTIQVVYFKEAYWAGGDYVLSPLKQSTLYSMKVKLK